MAFGAALVSVPHPQSTCKNNLEYQTENKQWWDLHYVSKRNKLLAVVILKIYLLRKTGAVLILVVNSHYRNFNFASLKRCIFRVLGFFENNEPVLTMISKQPFQDI